jgi:hypothetical protein
MSIIAAIDRGPANNIRELAAMHGLMFGTVRAILTDHPGLVKKSARVVRKLLSTDESTISFQALGTKKHLMQLVKKGQPGPVKSGVNTTRSDQMVLIFFHAKGMICMNYVPKGETVNAKYIKKSAARFLKIFRK